MTETAENSFGQRLLSAVAWIISVIFHPIVVPLVGCVLYLLCSLSDYGIETAMIALKMTWFPSVMLLYAMPLCLCGIYAAFFVRKHNMQESYHRVWFTSIIAISLFLTSFNTSMWQMFNPYLSSCYLVIGGAAFLSVFSRISFHAMGVGGLLGLLCYLLIAFPLSRNFILILIQNMVVIAGVVCTARLIRKAHTPLQIISGFFYGLCSTFLLMLLFE